MAKQISATRIGNMRITIADDFFEKVLVLTVDGGVSSSQFRDMTDEERGASRRRRAERTSERKAVGYNQSLRRMLRPYRNVYAIDYSIERLGYDIDVVVYCRQTHVGCHPSEFDPGEADEFDIIAVEIPDDIKFEPMRGLVLKFDDLPMSEQDELRDWIYENHRP